METSTTTNLVGRVTQVGSAVKKHKRGDIVEECRQSQGHLVDLSLRDNATESIRTPGHNAHRRTG